MAIRRSGRRFAALSLVLAAALLGGAGGTLFGVCGPFTDVSDVAFCPFVLEIFTLGITTGTTPTTYDPASSVSRLQMAAFLSRTVDGVVKRGHSRAAQERFWNPKNNSVLALTTVGGSARFIRSDGTDVWVASGAGTVSRVRVGDGKLLETWTGASGAIDVVIAAGRVLVAGFTTPGSLYAIDPTQTVGAVTTVASTLPNDPVAIAFDGARVWTANQAGSISIITPGAIPWTVTTVTAGLSIPHDVLYDGANIWTADLISNAVLKLDSAGAILQTVTVGVNPSQLAFDGTNIWVTNSGSDSVTVFRASSGAILQTLTGNGLKASLGVAFDGERVLVTNSTGDSVSLWKAADLTPLGSFPMPPGSFPEGACSDGAYFWIALNGAAKLARF
jgi:hypothetical protein